MLDIMEHPAQKLCCLDKIDDLYFAAAGPYIYSISRGAYDIVSKWPAEGDDGLFKTQNGLAAHNDRTDEPPSKKRKVSDQEAAADTSDSSVSVEIVAQRAKGQRRKAKSIESKLPNVSHLVAAKDQKHVIAVSAEDKCIRVFELANTIENGHHRGMLKLLTQRCMPKRMCAIVLTPDDSTILVADKFGDVYSLPLHPTHDVPASLPVQQDASFESNSTTIERQKPTADFKSSASELTVHTKGNREALRQQREQKAAAKTKEGPTFEHKLLLGHVSLLTDLIMVEADVEGKRRQYILTADRDEHIRVSRGPSQAHVTENYCLGHKEFVSKLCILPWQSDILVSGGGDTSIKTFHWQTGVLAGDLPVFDIISEAVSKSSHDIAEHKPLRKIAVSGIWPVTPKMGPGYLGEPFGFVLVAFEGLPLLLSLKWSSQQKLVSHQTVELPGNALDVLVFQQTILISTDNVHKPGSVKDMRKQGAPWADGLCESHLLSEKDHGGQERDGGMRWSPIPRKPGLAAHEIVSTSNEKATYSALGEFLYGLENLRKNRV